MIKDNTILTTLTDEEIKKYDEEKKNLSYTGDEYSAIVRGSVKIIVNESGNQMLLIRYLVNEDNFKNAKKELHDKKLMELMKSHIDTIEKMKLDDQKGIYKKCNSIICQLYFYKNWMKGSIEEFLYVYNNEDKHFNSFHVIDRYFEITQIEPYYKKSEK